ncbi:hypothetical protein [Plantactinospora sp. B24E8]|uniref:hypothetical protein n=1 Tax=Plantactinospora sp. B24E8 TaxID=3153567 RepID=UPI00325D1658
MPEWLSRCGRDDARVVVASDQPDRAVPPSYNGLIVDRRAVGRRGTGGPDEGKSEQGRVRLPAVTLLTGAVLMVAERTQH